MSPQERRNMGSVALDALAAIAASERGDYASVTLLLNTLTPAEMAEFAIALIGHGGQLLRAAAHASGVAPDKITGAVAASIREDGACARG